MKKLKKILEFMEKDFSRATDLITNVLGKKMGVTLYKNSQPYYFKTSKGEFASIQYFVGESGDMIRTNWEASDKSRKIVTVDIFKGDKQYTIDLKGSNINKVIDVIVGAYEEPEQYLNGEIITENKKTISLKPITEAVFVDKEGQTYASRKAYIKHLMISGWDDEQIWTVVDKNYYNPKMMNDIRAEVQADGGRQGVVTVSMASQEIAIPSPKVKSAYETYKELEEQYWSDPDTIYEDLVSLVKTVGAGNVNSLILSGSGGVGKTFRTKKVLKGMGLKEGHDFIMLKGGGAPLGIYTKIFQHKDKILIFDDFDDVWKDLKTVNILKAILDTTDPRQVDWVSKSDSVWNRDDVPEDQLKYDPRWLDEGKAPDSFLFTGQCIFITNLYKYQLDDAVISRSLALDIAIKQKDMIKLMEQLAPGMNLGITEEQTRKMLEILGEDADDYEDELPKEIVKRGIQKKMKTLRTMVNGAGILKTGLPEEVAYRLIRKYA